jgi:hypothetical protein
MEVIYGEIDRSVILGHASSIGDVQQRVGGERRRTRTGYGHLACLGWRRERRSCASGTGVPTHIHHSQRRRHDYLANQDLQSAQLTSKAGANGTTTYTVVNGVGGNEASVLRFLPVNLTVKLGDSVTWLGNDPHREGVAWICSKTLPP